MDNTNKISIHWFRRDLRLNDNHALFSALSESKNVLPIFIFDKNIIEDLPKNDARISFIYLQLGKISQQLSVYKSSLLCLHGNPLDIFQQLNEQYCIEAVYSNKDYEPYAIKRDAEINFFLAENRIEFKQFKDHVIFEENEIQKADNTPYTVYTPYKRKWLQEFTVTQSNNIKPSLLSNLFECNFNLPSLSEIGFERSTIKVKYYDISNLKNYTEARNFPCLDSTSYLSVHLRFGTVSIREIFNEIKDNETFVSELIWREFFIQILYHFPKVINQNFRAKYNGIQWRNNEQEFEKWKLGKTGYPIVDAGIRQLNTTGYMHNRVRMIVASFLCKHLLINWQWGEAYFAEKLLDYDLASNNGNWQWAAGTGCDATPYFRVFNPAAQTQKFDPNFKYIKRWVQELDTIDYPLPIVEHNFARKRALQAYKIGIEKTKHNLLYK